MTKIEMLNEWKKASAIKQEFCKAFGERFPHMCYSDKDLLDKALKTLQELTGQIAKVADGEPDKAVKAKSETKKDDESEAKPESKAKAKKDKAKADAKVEA